MSSSQAKALAFKEQLEEKIRGLIEEFALGKISREQFHVIYEKYNAQIEIAKHALASGNPDAVTIAQGGPPTIAIRDAYMGKAVGLLIYHNHSGKVLETLGEFNIPLPTLKPVLNQFTDAMVIGDFIERRTLKVGEKQWLVFSAGHDSTVVTLFLNQPSDMQNREIERLHHDFEEANRALLQKSDIDGKTLVMPFLVFVKKKVK